VRWTASSDEWDDEPTHEKWRRGAEVELNLGPYTVQVVRDDATDLRLAEAGLSGESNLHKGVIYVRSDLDSCPSA
jgi:hypothetical protein